MSESEVQEAEVQEEKVYDFSNHGDLISAFRDDLSEDKIKSLISEHLEKLIKDSGVTGYEVAFLYDDDNSINTFHSNRIYHAVKDLNKNKEG